jgi:hypothetical protein
MDLQTAMVREVLIILYAYHSGYDEIEDEEGSG